MPQFCVETFAHQLWGFVASICFCRQCSFLINLFVIIFSQTVQLMLESFHQQQTMLGTMWGYLRFRALLIHHTTDPTNKQVIHLHLLEIYKPVHFWQAVLLLLDFIGVQLWSCALQVFFLDITWWPKYHHSLFGWCLLYIVHKIDIQYFEQIYHLHLINIVGSISWLAALLSHVHYGSHHNHMGTDLES